MKISVIGAGGWGTTLANIIADKGNKVKLWALEKEVARDIKEKRQNSQFLPNARLSDNIEPTNELKEAVSGADVLVVAVPSEFFRRTAKEMAKYIKKGAIVVSATKGLEEGTSKRM